MPDYKAAIRRLEDVGLAVEYAGRYGFAVVDDYSGTNLALFDCRYEALGAALSLARVLSVAAEPEAVEKAILGFMGER